MKRVGKFILAILLVFAMVLPTASVLGSTVTKEFYIALDGNDQNPGTKDAPFATLEAARDAIRTMKQDNGGLPTGGIRVYLREGTYLLQQGFKLDAQDSGTKECPIIYTSYPGEKVNIYGGAQLPVASFKNVTDKDALVRIPKTVAKKVLQFDLKQAGITDYGTAQSSGYHITQPFPMPQLYYNDKILNLARWPNEGFSTYSSVGDGGLTVEQAQEKSGSKDLNVFTKIGGARIYYSDEEVDKWKNAKDILIFGYYNFGWAENTLVVKELNTNDKSITFEGPTAYGVKENKEFYAMNLLEELDVPGEWYIDRDTGILYLYPEGDIKKASIQLSTLKDNLITLNECDFTTFADLNLGLTLGNAVSAYECQDVLIRRCTIFKTGSDGVSFTSKWGKDGYMDVTYWPLTSVGTRSKNNGVVDSNIYGTGGSGVEIANGDRVNLIAGDGFAENNEIHDYAQINRTYHPAVNLWGCGNSARFNDVYNAPHMGMQFNGNDLAIENNDFHDVVKETDDSGVIYSFGQNSYLGNKVDYNYIHNIKSTTINTVGVMGIYLDDHISGVEMIGNVLDGIVNTGFFLKGKNNTVRYNIIKDVSRGFYFSDFDVGRNMTAMYDKNKESGFLDSPIWKAHYPQFADAARLEGSDVPTGNVADKNVFIGSSRSIDNTFQAESTIENNLDLDITKAGFVDSGSGNFNLKDDSEVLAKIQDFPRNYFDKIGRYNERFDAINKNQVSLFINSPVAFAKGIETRVDPNNIDVMPVILNDRTLVPVRFIAESFGADVGWNADERAATVTLDDKTIKLTLDSNQMDVNGAISELDVPAQVISDRTMIPLRALVEALGKKVFWDPRGLISIGDSEKPFGDDSYLVDSLIRYFR